METKLLKERLDYIQIMGDTSHISHNSEMGYYRLKHYFMKAWGMPLLQRGTTLKFKTRDGERTIVVTFSKAKGNIKGNRIQVEFPGSFLYGNPEDREYEIRAFINKLWDDLQILESPYVAVFDIAIDRLGATFGTHGVRLNDSNKYKVVHRRSSRFNYKVQPYHNNPDNKSEQTGQQLFANKLDFKQYDRNFALKTRYRGHKYKNYADYYWRLYEEYERVLRTEVKYKKELCELFNILFFSHGMPIKKILPKCLSLFIKNHKFIHAKSGRPIKKIEELFYNEKLLSLKQYRSLAHHEPAGELKYKCPKYDDNRIINQLSRHLLSTGGISDEEIMRTVLRTRKALRQEIDKFIGELKSRLVRDLKLSSPEKHHEITQKYQEELNSLNELKEKIPEDVEHIKGKFLSLINNLKDSDTYIH